MQKRWLMRLLILVILANIAVGFAWTAKRYVFVGGDLYPRDATQLDLRNEEVSVKKFRKLAEKLPECEILWNVPLHNGSIPNTKTELTITSLTDEDVEALSCMPFLERVEGRSCDDYAQLAALKTRNPQIDVIYNVKIANKKYNQDSKKVVASSFSQEDAQNLAYLPSLNQVKVSSCDDYAFLQQLQQEHPEWNLSYTVKLGDDDYASDAMVVTATGASYKELTTGLAGLTNLKVLNLVNPNADAHELISLRTENPDITVKWQVEIYGQVATEATTELDISGAQVRSCEEVEELVACLPKLEKLIMSDCGIGNEEMAAFRERQREKYKVVWTVQLSAKAKCRTDDTYFMPIKQGEYYLLDQHTENLKYCEDMVCIDVGHHKIHNIDFVANMPNLKYLVIAHTEVQDVSPIVNCQELIYLEVDWSTIKDYTPIAQLKKLEDLNLNQTYCDLTPIMEMTWLKNLWMPGRGYEWGQKMTAALPNTNVVLTNVTTLGMGWRNLQNYYDMRDYLGMPYMN